MNQFLWAFPEIFLFHWEFYEIMHHFWNSCRLQAQSQLQYPSSLLHSLVFGNRIFCISMRAFSLRNLLTMESRSRRGWFQYTTVSIFFQQYNAGRQAGTGLIPDIAAVVKTLSQDSSWGTHYTAQSARLILVDKSQQSIQTWSGFKLRRKAATYFSPLFPLPPSSLCCPFLSHTLLYSLLSSQAGP